MGLVLSASAVLCSILELGEGDLHELVLRELSCHQMHPNLPVLLIVVVDPSLPS